LYRCQDEVAATGHENGWTGNEKVARMGLLSWWIEWAAGMGVLSWWIEGAAAILRIVMYSHSLDCSAYALSSS